MQRRVAVYFVCGFQDLLADSARAACIKNWGKTMQKGKQSSHSSSEIINSRQAGWTKLWLCPINLAVLALFSTLVEQKDSRRN